MRILILVLLFTYSKAGNLKVSPKETDWRSSLSQVQYAEATDDQKLLRYRKLIEESNDLGEKKEIIQRIGELNTFLSLVYLDQFLEDKELQQTAARSITQIALPEAGGKEGFSGQVARKILERVRPLVKVADAQNIQKYLEEDASKQGFVTMFNGENLDGWKGLVENPIERSKMGKRKLAKRQREADINLQENWSVRDHMIIFNGKGNNLCSVKDYGDFELILDWRISKGGDSGIYLRGTPQVQIWDTANVNVGAQVGSGGLYNNKQHESKPLMVADNPVGEWNTFRITMIKENVTVYLNGVLVVDNIPLENYWDRSQPIFTTGPIELQAHGNELAFRDIYVREIDN